jgi:anaerobic selenocysteine-containing dehydrogenase
MKRRDFLKSTLLFAAVSTVAAKATGIFNNAYAAGTFAAVGKLGYKEVSPHIDKTPKKTCATCKHYKAHKEAGENAGECVLVAMKNAMKPATTVFVKDEAYCNMWAAQAKS